MKLANNKDNTIKASIILPCYKVKGKIRKVVNEISSIANDLKNKYKILIFVVDDCCPDMSWKEIKEKDNIFILHHTKNKGVGASFLTGLNAASQADCDVYVKIDSDGQHLPLYLYEIIPYILNLPKNKLTLLKGNRFYMPNKNKQMPLIRRIGSLVLEPISRLAIGYRGLSDVANGFIAFNKITANYLFNESFNPKLERRYLFESSLIAKSRNLDCEIHEFLMCARYDNQWKSSLNSWKIIIPLCIFFIKTTISRFFKIYILKLNLGSLALLSSISSFLLSLYIFIIKIYPLLINEKSLSAGRISIFTSLLLINLLSSGTFLIYDYYLRKKTKKIKFYSMIDDVELLNKNYKSKNVR